MVSGEEAAGERRKTQSLRTITTALTIATVAVIGNTVTSTLAEAIVGGGAGAAAGAATLQLLWGNVNTGKAALAVPAVAGGIAGTTAALFLSLLGAQSLTGSAVTAAIAGAAIVTVGRKKLQWAIETIQSIPYTLCKLILKLLCKAVLKGPALAAAAADIFNKTLQEGLTATASELVESELAALGPASGPEAASGLAASETGLFTPGSSRPTASEPGLSTRGGQGSSGPRAPESAASGRGASKLAASGPGSSGPGAPESAASGPGAPELAASGPGSSGPGTPESAASGPGTSRPRAPESAGSGPESSGPGTPESTSSGTGSSRPRVPESAASGPGAPESASSGPGSSRPRAPESAGSGPELSVPGAPESTSSGPGSSGPTAPESASSGPGSSGPRVPESAGSGPGSSGPGAPKSTSSGPASSGPTAPESASSGPGSSGPRVPESAGSGPGSSGPGAPESTSSGPTAPESASSVPGSSGPRVPESAGLGPEAPESATTGPASTGPRAPESATSGPRVPESAGSGPRAPESATSGPRAPESASSGPGAPESATTGPASTGPRAPESATSGPGAPESATNGPASSGPRSPETAASGPGAPESATTGPASSGPRSPETTASGPGAPESATTGPASSGPGAPESATTGPASTGPRAPESATSGPGAPESATSGPRAPESATNGPASSGPRSPETAASGPGAPESATTGPASSGPRSPETTASGPGAPDSATTGPASSGPGAPESATTGPASSGPGAPESATSGPTASGPEAPASTASGPGAPESASSGPTASGQDASGPASSTPIIPPLFAGANAAAGAVGGLVGGFIGGRVAQAGSDMNISEQKGQSQAKSTVMKNESSQTEESPMTDKCLQTEESSLTDELSKTVKSLQTDESSQTEESPMADKTLQTEGSSQTDKSSQTEDSPKIDRCLQRDESSQTSLMTESSEITDKQVATVGGFKNSRPTRNSPDQQLQQKQQLFYKLHLSKNKNVLRRAEILQFTAHSLPSHESCAEEELVQTFIQKLLMMDYRARHIKTHKTIKQCNVHRDISRDESVVCDIFDEMSLPNEGASESERIHPMDVQMAVFHCADGLLKQLMVTKLSHCQFALPLLVPDPFTRLIEFPLWTFRQIHKSWKMRNNDNEIVSQTQPIYKAQTPMVFFFRFGSVSSSKSQLMSSLINEKHNTFFHRNCPGSSRTRVVMDGVVEIAWFCPSGKNTDKFTDCVAFCNLHGDAGDHEKQLKILTEMASVNVALLPRLDRNDRHARIIQNLYSDRKPLICLFTKDESTVTETKKWKFKIGMKDRNQSDVSEELRQAINDCLSESSFAFRLEDVSKHSDIRVDEEDNEDCRRGREAAKQMMSLLENKDLREIKQTFLPHQGKLWHQWSQKNRELHRGHGDEIEMVRGNQTELMEIREQQHRSDISEFMRLFTKEMSSDAVHMMLTLKWFRMLLNEHTSTGLSVLHHKYNKKWSAVEKLQENHNTSLQLKAEQAELERIYGDLQAATFGLEHIMREIGQIYESCLSVKKSKKDPEVHFSSLPILAAEMMISGFPLELMDGDAAHVPVIWISAVLDQLIQELGDQTRVFVLSVLGLQSSGKSTMLNTIFGHEFPISSGRCTRGAFMQLVKVSDEMKTQINFDYILVVDTEGLCALELPGRSTRHHDNELATFVVGLGNLTLINIFGETSSEMQDILQIVVQAFMRMKKVRLNPSCVFVHQNVSDVTAGEKNMEGRRQLIETLDELTKLAAKEEVCDVERFSDVIRFDVQKDVNYFTQLWEGSPPMAPPNPKYCENVQELKETIKTSASKSNGMMLTQLKDRIEDLWEAVLKDHFVFSFRNSLEISAYRKLETEYSRWSLSLRSAMMEIENKLQIQIKNEEIHEVEEADLQRELKETSEEVEKSMSKFFENDRDANMLNQWKTTFEMKIKTIQENIIRETLRKLNEILQQRDLKKTIDAQKTHHENALYEKSKELALNLKDKAKDEETLKKEFDTFWEQSVKEIIKDAHPIKDIDVMRDVREILCDVYKSAPVDHWTERMDIVEIYVSRYSDYLKLKKLSGKQGTNAYRSVEGETDYIQSQEVEDQIISLITDVVQQTDSIIQSFNISEMGYNIRVVQQLIDYIKIRVTEHEVGPVKYVFKNEFFTDLVYSIFNLESRMIIDQHRLFREANDLVVYVEKKRDEYYNIFQKYCHEAASAVVFAELICEKLKEPIEQSLLKELAKDLTDEIKMNCVSLNGNRSKLGKNILKILTNLNEFQKSIPYQNPRALLNSLIRNEVSRYTTDHFNITVSPRMKENIELWQQKILTAAHESTEHVQLKSGDIGLWWKSFTQRLSDELIFSEEHLSGVRLEDVDFNILEDVIRDKLPDVTSDINTKTSPVNLACKFRPDELLINQLCRICWLQFCINTIENHNAGCVIL